MIVKRERAQMFNKQAEENADRIISALDIQPGDVIADLGSGGGYLTFIFAGITGSEGKVFAVDTDTGLLAYIQEIKQKDNVKNVETIVADSDNPKLPDHSCDLIFLRNAFHHIPQPVVYFNNTASKLKQAGRIAIIEWQQGAHPRGHGIAQDDIAHIMTAAGYRRTQSFDSLERQSFQVFQVAD